MITIPCIETQSTYSNWYEVTAKVLGLGTLGFEAIPLHLRRSGLQSEDQEPEGLQWCIVSSETVPSTTTPNVFAGSLQPYSFLWGSTAGILGTVVHGTGGSASGT